MVVEIVGILVIFFIFLFFYGLVILFSTHPSLALVNTLLNILVISAFIIMLIALVLLILSNDELKQKY